MEFVLFNYAYLVTLTKVNNIESLCAIVFMPCSRMVVFYFNHEEGKGWKHRSAYSLLMRKAVQ